MTNRGSAQTNNPPSLQRLALAFVRPGMALARDVYDEDGTVIGEYFADLFVDGRLIVELKACRALAPEHTAQTLGYLKSARIEDGMLINFGSFRFQIQKYALRDAVRPKEAIGEV